MGNEVKNILKNLKKEFIIRLGENIQKNNIPEKPGVYCIFNIISNKCYIGITKNLQNRLYYRHLCQLRNRKHSNEYLQRSWDRHGENNFLFIILNISNDITSLSEKEQYYLNLILKADEYVEGKNNFFKENGYNITPISDFIDSTKFLNSKKILQYDLNGNFIAEWKSVKEAETTTKIKGISQAVLGKYKTSGNFVWRLKVGDKIDDKIEIENLKKSYKNKKILQYTLEGEFVKEWKNRSEIKRYYNTEINSKTCLSSTKRRLGFLWRFKDGNEIPQKIEVPKLYRGLPNRKVLQYDLDGNLIKIWENTTQIKNELGFTDINSSCNNRTKTIKGSMWRYMDDECDEIPLKIDVPKFYEQSREILQYSLDGVFICKWNKISDIHKKLKLIKVSIHRVCLGQRKTYAGFIWKYKENDDYPLQLDMTINGRKDVIKKVEQYDLDGKYIKTWGSINSAQKTLKCGGIFSALKKGKNISCGFVWKLVE